MALGPIEPLKRLASSMSGRGGPLPGALEAFTHGPGGHGVSGDGLNRSGAHAGGDPLASLLGGAAPGGASPGAIGHALQSHKSRHARAGRRRGRGPRRSSHGRKARGGHPGRSRRAASVKASRAAATPGAQTRGAKDFRQLTQKLQGMGISKQDISNLSKKYGVPEKMILATMMQESGGNPHSHSGAGAMGLMQLMPGTARALGVKNPMDPKQNLEGGVKYMGQMLQQFHGNQSLALAAYNAGPGRVQKAGGIPHIAETQNYVRRITGNLGAAEQAFNNW